MSRKTLKLLPVIVSLVVAVSPWAQAADEMTGELIDQLMRKQAGEVVTAESALPQKHAAAKVDAAKADVMKNDAAKSEILKTETVSTANTIGTALPVNAAAAKVATAAAGPEDQQPVFTNPAALNKEKSTTSSGAMARMFGSLAVVLLLIGGAMYGLKKWPGAQKLAVRNKMIEVISQHHLGPKKSLALVRVAGETVLIGVTDNNISILKTLALLDDDLPRETAASSGEKKPAFNFGQKFQSTLASKFSKSASPSPQNENSKPVYNRQAKVQAPQNDQDQFQSDLDNEEFAMKGLREIVGERLKTMKEL